MLCPVCKDTQLVMSDRKNIEIDYCPNCRGVWLDRGELDKIIEKSAEELAAAFPATRQVEPRQRNDYERRDKDYDRHYSSRHHKKKSFWMELFD